jgi:hypothetical protein
MAARPYRYTFTGSPGPTTVRREVTTSVDGKETGNVYTAAPTDPFVAIGEYEEDGQLLQISHTDIKKSGNRLRPRVVSIRLPENLDPPPEGRIEPADEPAAGGPQGVAEAEVAPAPGGGDTAPAASQEATGGDTAPATGDAAATE